MRKQEILPTIFQNDRIDNCTQLSRSNVAMLRMTVNKFYASFSWDCSALSAEGLWGKEDIAASPFASTQTFPMHVLLSCIKYIVVLFILCIPVCSHNAFFGKFYFSVSVWPNWFYHLLAWDVTCGVTFFRLKMTVQQFVMKRFSSFWNVEALSYLPQLVCQVPNYLLLVPNDKINVIGRHFLPCGQSL